MTTSAPRDSKFLCYALLLALAACSSEPDTAAEPPSPAAEPNDTAGFLPPNAPAATECGANGRLTTSFVGALQGTLDWQTDQLACEGMPRPEGRGARLRFANAPETTPDVAIIISIPDLLPDSTAGEFPSVVTVIESAKGRFFSSADLDTCWTEIIDQVSNDGDGARIDGELYCISPLAEINGTTSLTITALQFSGRIDWTPDS